MKFIRWRKSWVAWTPLPVIIKANAGLPNLNSGGYDISPEQFASQMEKYMDLGVNNYRGDAVEQHRNISGR